MDRDSSTEDEDNVNDRDNIKELIEISVNDVVDEVENVSNSEEVPPPPSPANYQEANECNSNQCMDTFEPLVAARLHPHISNFKQTPIFYEKLTCLWDNVRNGNKIHRRNNE